MLNSVLYAIWKPYLEQHLPDNCRTRLENMLLLVVGMFQAGSVHLSKVARKLPIDAQKLSLTRRLRRFLDNEAVDVRSWYHPWASHLIESASSGGQLNLIIDTTKISSKFRKISVAVAYKRRALPLMWDWVPYARGHCTVNQQIALFQQLRELIPADVRVSLVGDGEFGNPLLIEYLDFWGWDYALRQKSNTKIWMRGAEGWQRLDELGIQRGDQWWIGHVVLTEASSYPAHVVTIWHPNEKEPILLATNQLDPKATWRLYKRRMWIEEMFGDMKGHGFDLEASCLGTADRLSRLTMVVCILYLWLVAQGEALIRDGQTHLVDRRDRRDLSIFRLGWDYIERLLALQRPIPEHFCPNFCSVSGG